MSDAGAELTVAEATVAAEWWDGRPAVGRWAVDAACRAYPVDWWFPTSLVELHTTGAQAIAICKACPVQGDCLRHAVDTGEDHGIWGGHSERARRRIRRRLFREAS